MKWTFPGSSWKCELWLQHDAITVQTRAVICLDVAFMFCSVCVTLARREPALHIWLWIWTLSLQKSSSLNAFIQQMHFIFDIHSVYNYACLDLLILFYFFQSKLSQKPIITEPSDALVSCSRCSPTIYVRPWALSFQSTVVQYNCDSTLQVFCWCSCLVFRFACVCTASGEWRKI